MDVWCTLMHFEWKIYPPFKLESWWILWSPRLNSTNAKSDKRYIQNVWWTGLRTTDIVVALSNHCTLERKIKWFKIRETSLTVA